jgi:hypothetical protein
MGYFALANTPTPLRGIRHRFRAIIWTHWKRIRYHHLRALGLPEWRVRELAGSRKGPWLLGAQGLSRLLKLYAMTRLRWQ